MRTLYHFRFSPFSRRVRLALAHKGLPVTLREARENSAWMAEAQGLVAFRTIPVLVDGEHGAIGDSTVILHALDALYPDAPRLWPAGTEAPRALQTVALVDVVLDGVIDLATRYFPLRGDPAWAAVKDEMLGRSVRAAESLAALATETRDGRGPGGQGTVCASGWSAADMALFTMVQWIEGWPARASTSPNVAQLVTLGFELPAALPRWADAHRQRPDVLAVT